MPLGIRVGILRVIAAGLFVVVALPLACVTAVGASSRGRPRLTGVESGRNEGNPSGRSSGTISNTPTANACMPKEVKAVNPRRERSSHDELSVEVNMVSSLVKCVAGKDTGSAFAGWAEAKKKSRA
jgi:hypothetical protein